MYAEAAIKLLINSILDSNAEKPCLDHRLNLLKGAYLADSFLEASNEQKSDIKLVLTNCAVLTWFNPHVYIDTLILIGTVSIRFEDPLHFGLGACLASFIFFFSLAFGARLLSPLVSSKKAWQILDLVIASIMFVLAFSMFQEVF